ncbi:vegetative cell wall protein gp1-like [Chenopodium quinoa]|uniref:vegetative cell wall protein gp1-like n=1 Tax=Chenopodium quinoa TaxID=63459 RepID=UPI000B7756B7|nr:vegetative cell wall protein gp1-like [Chenopodium quinoa]
MVIMMAGIVLFMSMQFMPSLAQRNTPFCWDRIQTCRRGAETPMEFQQVCCPVVLQIVSNEMPCFCSIKSSLNATDVDGISMLLTVCNVTASYNKICPGVPSPSPPGTPSAPPLSTTPTPSASSPGPNSSPNVTPLAPPPGPNSSPSDTPSPTPTGEASSLTPNPTTTPLGEGPSTALSPINPPLGSAESPTALSPNGNTTETGASNKIEMVGPLSALLVLSTCVLF